SGAGGVARLNLDEQNGLQFINEALVDDTVHTTALVKSGETVFAARAIALPEGKTPDGCAFKSVPGESKGVSILNYLFPTDPVSLGTLAGVSGSSALHLNHHWLYSGGTNSGAYWGLDGCPIGWRSTTSGKPQDAEVSTLTAVNLLDQTVTQQYELPGNLFDVLTYGDYIIAALGSVGVEIFHRDQPEQRIRVAFDQSLQAQVGRALRLSMQGSTLFVAANRGIVVMDLSNVQAPRIISAGNDEAIEGVDLYRDRLVTASAQAGLQLFELPGALVTGASVAHQGELPSTLDEPLMLSFNELVTLESVATAGAVSLYQVDPLSGQEQEVPVSLTAQPDGEVTEAARHFIVNFDRSQSGPYRLRVESARNLRGQGLWAPYHLAFNVVASDLRRPIIHDVIGGAFHFGDQPAIRILGEHFSAVTQVYVGQYLISATLDADGQLIIPENATSQLPLVAGQHHLRIVNGPLDALWPGALVVAEPINNIGQPFRITPDFGLSDGGILINVQAQSPVILPGSKIILRAKHSPSEIYTGYGGFDLPPGLEVVNLRDDVVQLNQFQFVLPGVIEPDLYELYLRMPYGEQTKEVYVGEFSYLVPQGRSIDLPNYPPMEIGAMQAVGDTLLIGVKAGAKPTAVNRFLMEAGLEIYDTRIWDRPIRISQMRTTGKVTGLEVVDQLAFLAAGSQGLLLVDLNNLAKPLVVNELNLPAHRALDVAVDRNRGVLAVAAANELGTGYIRFFALGSENLGPAPGFATIQFDQGSSADEALLGMPVDIQWQDGKLYVLLARLEGEKKTLHLVVISSFGNTPAYSIQ